MRLTHAQRRRITRLARSKEPITDPNDLRVVAIFLRGVLSGWFAVKRGRLRGGTWVFLGIGIAGLIGRVVARETLLTAILPIPFLAMQPSGTGGCIGAGPAPPKQTGSKSVGISEARVRFRWKATPTATDRPLQPGRYRTACQLGSNSVPSEITKRVMTGLSSVRIAISTTPWS